MTRDNGSGLTADATMTAQVDDSTVRSVNPATPEEPAAVASGAAPAPQRSATAVQAESEPSATDRLRALAERNRNREPEKTVWTTSGGEGRDEPSSRREMAEAPADSPTRPPPEGPPERAHRMPDDTLDWASFVRQYPRRPPEVVLTAHRYHSEPQKRLAIINMRRYKPGERVTPESVLRDIVPQGVVLLIDGQNVLIEANR